MASSVLELWLLLLLFRGSVLLLRGLVRRLLLRSSVLLARLLAVISLRSLEGRVLWSGSCFGKQFGVQVGGFLQFLWQRWWSGQMISHRLETSGVGLVLDAVQLAIGTGVRVSTGNDLLTQLGSNFAVVSVFLVLDAVAGCVVKVVTSVAVVYVLVAENRDRSGTGLLKSTLESSLGTSAATKSGLTSGGRSSVGLLRSLGLLLGIVTELTVGLATMVAKGRYRWVSTLVASLASWR